jgi:FKBP-type peptidyl-prolyl cis-trans isomerase FkpA
MKKLLYIIIAFIAFAFASCRKSSDNFTIKQFDDNSIQNYINANGLGSVMKHDAGDTTGIYYQIISPGTASVVDYPTVVSYAYSYHTFDGDFSTTDTILNHTNNYLGHVSPAAIQLSIKNIIKNKGGKVRLLIPSRLAFGTNGYFAGPTNLLKTYLRANW